MRVLAVAVVVCCAVVGLSRAAEIDAAIRKPTNIPAQALEPALHVFSKERAIQVVYRSETVGDLRTGGANGELTADEALKQLLQGTGLTFRYLADKAVTIVPSGLNSFQAVREAFSLAQSFSPSQGESAQQADKDGEGTRNGAGNQASDDEQVDVSSNGIQEVIVTATKRAESVHDIPMSIAVIGNQDIERRGLIGMEDYLRAIPGVNQIDNGASGNAVVIRGITTSPEAESFSAGITVASYFGETPISGAAGTAADNVDVRPVDIQRIEVLRGPQGTAYGSSSLGGTVRIIPMAPRLDAFSARLGASYSGTAGEGSDNTMLQGVVNIPLVENKFALRAVGYRYDESGFYRNSVDESSSLFTIADNFGLGDFARGHAQDDVGRMHTVGGRLAALWQATDKLDLSANFLTQTIEQDGLPRANGGKYTQTALPIASQVRVRGEIGEAADTEMKLANLVLNYDFGWAGLTSAVSWIDGGSLRNADLTATFQLPASTPIGSDFKSFTAETRLASQLDGRFQFLGGLFYEDTQDDFLQTLDWPGTPATSPFGTNPMAYIQQLRNLDQRAIFGEFSYDLSEKLTATVGGRYFKYEKDESSLREGGLFAVPLGAGVQRALANSENGSSFKANLSYKPTQDALVYASWAEGFRLGRPATGLPPATCDRDNDGLLDGSSVSIESTRSINSDFLENYEIGGKFTFFDRRMVVDTSVYHIKWDGLPIRSIASACSLAYVANVGAATSDGVELQASLLVVDGLRLDFGGGYTRAKLSEDAPGLQPAAFAGDRLPGSPKVSANLAAQYDFEISGRHAFVRADSFYAGEFYGDLAQSPLTRAGDYIKLDARAGVAIANLSLELFVRNLTNEDNFTWRGLSNTNSSFGYRLRPRTIGVQLGYTFE